MHHSSLQRTSSITLSDKLTIIAIIIAIVAVIVSVWAVRRWGVRRHRILLTYASNQLIPDLSPLVGDDALKVTFKELPIENPHLVFLRLQNIGPQDIASDDFDSQRRITLNLNCKFYVLLKGSHPKFTFGPAVGAECIIEIAPLLLKRGEAWELALIVSGPPELESEIPLKNTDVLDKRTFDAKVTSSFLVAAVGAISSVVPGSGIVMAAIDALLSGRSKDL